MSDVDSVIPYLSPRPDSVGILLAAGFGRRFASLAAGANKLLAPMPDGTPVAAASARALRQSVACVIAVLRPDCPELLAVLRKQGCHIYETPMAQEGMGASLAAVARYLQSEPELGLEQPPASLLLALADMPWIRPSTYGQVLDAVEHWPVAAPTFNAQRGHPVGFRAELLPELAQLGGDTGARSVLARHEVRWLPCDDPGILRDVDEPSDLAGTR